MKKLIIITILSTVILWIINMLNYYLFNYPVEFNLLVVFKESIKWGLLVTIYCSIIFFLISITYSFYKGYAFLNYFLISVTCFNIVVISIMGFYGIKLFLENKKEYDELVLSFQKEAKRDIQNDNVKIFSYGLILPPKSEIEIERKKKIDSILKKYGLTSKHLGCGISYGLTNAQHEYEKTTNIYLEKRNGKFWRVEMQNKIDSIENRKMD